MAAPNTCLTTLASLQVHQTAVLRTGSFCCPSPLSAAVHCSAAWRKCSPSYPGRTLRRILACNKASEDGASEGAGTPGLVHFGEGSWGQGSVGLVPRGQGPSPQGITYSRPNSAMSEGDARGLILRAAMGTGWTSSTGMEGPSLDPNFPTFSAFSPERRTSEGGSDMEPMLMPWGLVKLSETATEEGGEERAKGGQGEGAEWKQGGRWPELSSSPRRTARVQFTCNKCGERTTRAINPHAYGEGTVFVQCGGCLVFHKLVDNLHLFHELTGPVFQGSTVGHRGFGIHDSVDVLGAEDGFSIFSFGVWKPTEEDGENGGGGARED